MEANRLRVREVGGVTEGGRWLAGGWWVVGGGCCSKELDLANRNKQSLLPWKVAKTQLLAELEGRVKKYEKWSHHDVDKLLLDIEKKVCHCGARAAERERGAGWPPFCARGGCGRGCLGCLLACLPWCVAPLVFGLAAWRMDQTLAVAAQRAESGLLGKRGARREHSTKRH